MCALWKEANLLFPALDALNEGYEVYPVVDAVGGTSQETHRAALERIVQAGGRPTTWNSVHCALQRDWNRTDPSLQTFNALFPKGAYFGEIALISPANHMDLQPTVDLRLTKRWTLSPEAGFFWRQSNHDGIYGPAINLLRSAGSSTSRFIGSQLAAQAEWEISRHFSWAGNYTHFFAGQFLQDTKPAKDVNYFTTWIYYHF
jgi:hypothetical protein